MQALRVRPKPALRSLLVAVRAEVKLASLVTFRAPTWRTPVGSSPEAIRSAEVDELPL